jgi:hypothetical protein
MSAAPSKAEVAALVGNPEPPRMLVALFDGRAPTAGERTYAAGASPQKTSEHLAQMTEAGSSCSRGKVGSPITGSPRHKSAPCSSHPTPVASTSAAEYPAEWRSRIRRAVWHRAVIRRQGDMSAPPTILMRMFGRSRGILGRVGGVIMAHTNGTAVADIINVLGVALDDEVLELGFGPGVGIQLLVKRISAGYVRGIDPLSN